VKRPKLPLDRINDRIELFSIVQALEGHPDWLLNRLRKGQATNTEQAVAADLIEGKIKPPRRNRRSPWRERAFTAEIVVFLKERYPDVPQKNIIEAVATSPKGERRVYEKLAEIDNQALAEIKRIRSSEPSSWSSCDRDNLVQIVEAFLERLGEPKK
jgi:hypothetical protein